MSGHSVEWEISRQGYITGRVICHEPPGAECRTVCNHSECEEGCIDDTHACEPIDYCNVKTWLEADLLQESYDGPVVPLRAGPIEIEWGGLAPTWSYADVPLEIANTERSEL